MKKKLSVIITLFLLLVINFHTTYAQNYRFRLLSADVIYLINADGTASIDYLLEFSNDPGVHVIDFVDLGLPNSNFDRSSITAEINDSPISDIQKADASYVPGGIGITLGLSSQAIPAGQSGTVHVYIPIIRQVIYPSTAQDVQDYVSSEFSPTWFGSQYVHGNTNYTFTLVLPPEMSPDEPRWHNPKNWPGSSEPVSGYDDQERIYYQWTSDAANGSTQYTFGASFPANYVPADSVVTQAPTSRPASSVRFNFATLLPFCCPIIVIGLTFAFSILGHVQNNKRKLKYMPPKISIEGHGIKRGLTAVQAAILLQEPVDKIITMILFSTIKKGAAAVVSRSPLDIKITDPVPEGLQDYELKFLEAYSKSNLKEQRRILQDMIIDLIKSVTQAIKGFSYKETVEYYKDITRRAWEQVEAAETPEIQMQKYDESMDWTMLDRRFEDRTRDVFRTRPVYVPMWWGNFDPTYRPAPIASAGAPSGGGKTTISMPTLPGADFAASMVTGIQTFSTNTIGNLTNFTSRITNQTNPPPPPTRSSYRGGGGGGRSCACACACAGCACACAGGGR